MHYTTISRHNKRRLETHSKTTLDIIQSYFAHGITIHMPTMRLTTIFDSPWINA